MYIFIDESGDSGLKSNTGSSRYFTVVLVAFTDEKQMAACDSKITELRQGLGKNQSFEFHFTDNSDRIRRSFLKTVAPLDFFYYAFILNKDPDKLHSPEFRNKETLYKKVCEYVFENARHRLRNAHVIIDKSGPRTFQEALAKYLKRLNHSNETAIIKKIKTQRSNSNNLLQLADYIAGVVNRKAQNKKNADDYRRFNADKEIQVQKWP